jgi:uncharacterized protein with PIN domain
VDPELQFLLPARLRAVGTLDIPHETTATLGHLVQSTGVPLTEVGSLVSGDRLLDPRHRPTRDDVVAVGPRPRPQPLEGPPALLLDVHLGRLARRLRLLGVDVAYRNDLDDDTLVSRARDEDRLLLTQDRGLLRRRGLRRAAYVRGVRPDDQLADVLDRFHLPLAPYSRCPTCGAALDPVAKEAVVDRLQPGTLRTQEEFRQCRGCAQVYWRGAHAERLDRLVRQSERSG